MSSESRVLIIEARDLDTDDRSLASFEVDMPTDEKRQQAQMVEFVAEVHPTARMRSFGDGAASFLDARHLVVAHYSGGNRDRGEGFSELSLPTAQQSLFAA